MARALYLRLGHHDDDTIGGFERAAIRRFHDAEMSRRASRRLAAIYLFGYAAEMWIKAAYFRFSFSLAGLPMSTRIDTNQRNTARGQWQALGLLRQPRPHDIEGWALLLIAHRANQGHPYGPQFRADVASNAAQIDLHWREFMRYRSVAVHAPEVHAVRSGVNWLRRHYPQL